MFILYDMSIFCDFLAKIFISFSIYLVNVKQQYQKKRDGFSPVPLVYK